MEETLTPKRRDVGGLSTLQFDAPDDAPAVVLFHGYGADAADLAPLAFELDLPKPVRWIFPDAPLSMGWNGRAWFPINLDLIEERQKTGAPIDWSQGEPDGFVEARAAAGMFLKELGLPWSKLILGGFSQGAMLTTDLALRAPENPRGLAILSGDLICAEAWRKNAPNRKGMPFFQSHGSADPMLSFQGALKLESLLKGAGLSGSLLRFEGGHAIPPEAQAGLRSFLAGLL